MDNATIDVKMGSERGFAIVFAAVFAIIALYPMLHGGDPRIWALVVAAAFLAVGFLRPQWLAVPNRLWFKFGMLLGAIVAPLVMALVFITVITPTGLIARLFRGNPMGNTRDPEAQSYWARRDSPMQPFTRQF